MGSQTDVNTGVRVELGIVAMIFVGLFASACASSAVDDSAASKAIAAPRDSAVHIVNPCVPIVAYMPKAINGVFPIYVGTVKVGTTTPCSHGKFAAPSGRHAVRLADPVFDIPGFGPPGDIVNLEAGKTTYFRAQSTGQGFTLLYEINSERGKAEIAAIESFER